MGRLNEIERAKRRVTSATGLFKTAHDELEAANEQLRQAQDFHANESRRHVSLHDEAKEAQAANNAVLDTLRTLVPGVTR